ncbi:DsbC family protein [Jeongeupia wiesaeckerbachi]|uniref:DsbC family protein n=1 Tax=Jeongeupia wiesaeckerbachi TaxID=3051218 RepID=UPI003D807A0F
MKLTRLTKNLAVIGMVALTACSAQADSKTDIKQIREKLASTLQGREITAVNASPIKGVYEVVIANRQIVYTDAQANFVIVGDMVDVAKKESVTERRMAELMKTDFNKLPFDQAFKEVRGTGARKLAVFSDPDCPFCKRLEQESLKGVDNVTIYTFLFPLNIHPDAERKSKLIWCADDKAAAWSNFMNNGKLPEGKADCATPIEKNLVLGESLGITGTPALVFGNGRIVSGAIPRQQVEQLLGAK